MNNMERGPVLFNLNSGLLFSRNPGAAEAVCQRVSEPGKRWELHSPISHMATCLKLFS
jgi:hypothetical protein